MADLEEVTVDGREGEGEKREYPDGEDSSTSTRKNAKRKRSRKRKSSGNSNNPEQPPASGEDPGGGVDKGGEGEQTSPPDNSQKQDSSATTEELRARFFGDYRKVAEEYDKEFNKRYDEDLNTTLIFAGLFSAVTSAFIIDVQSQLQPDPNEETAALLRVLLYKMDNTTFGDDVPAVPQWSGPPHMLIQVQVILYTSLAASLLSALLAMLGKQWLNQYASTEMRGTAVERARDRQRKLNGINTWYFEYVMESLPLMLQAALLLLGCALSRYLWEINTTIASVVLGVTAFGIIFYIFIVVAGTASESCPYQTPASRVLRSTPSTVVSIFKRVFKHSKTVAVFRQNARDYLRSPSRRSVTSVKGVLLELPSALVIDAFRLGRAVVRGLVAFVRQAYAWLRGSPSTPTHGSGQQTTLLDMQCASWILQTSLDKAFHLSTLESLATVVPLDDVDPIFVENCFNVFVGCIKVVNGTVVVTQGSERLAAASAICLLHTISYLLVMDPMQGVLDDVDQRYMRIFPLGINFYDHSSLDTLRTIGRFFNSPYALLHLRRGWWGELRWWCHKPSNHEHIVIAHSLLKLSQSEYQTKGEVPERVLQVVLQFLSWDPPLSAPIIFDCLSVIAIDLGCDISGARPTILDESALLVLICRKLETMIEAANPDPIRSKRKVITALFSHVAWQEQSDQQQKILDTILRAARASRTEEFIRYLLPISRLFNKESPLSAKKAAILVSPYIPLWYIPISRWAAVASVVPYTDEIGQSVVTVLLQIAPSGDLRPQVPVSMWSWLKKRPLLPPGCTAGRGRGAQDVVHKIRVLGDIEILTSYLYLVWSECYVIPPEGFEEMCTSIREDFGGIWVGYNREDLLRRLDRVLGQLGLGLEYLRQHEPSLNEDEIRQMKRQYGQLKEVLSEVDREANDRRIHSGYHAFRCAVPLL